MATHLYSPVSPWHDSCKKWDQNKPNLVQLYELNWKFNIMALAGILKLLIIFERVLVQNGQIGLKLYKMVQNCHFLLIKNESDPSKWRAWWALPKALLNNVLTWISVMWFFQENRIKTSPIVWIWHNHGITLISCKNLIKTNPVQPNCESWKQFAETLLESLEESLWPDSRKWIKTSPIGWIWHNHGITLISLIWSLEENRINEGLSIHHLQAEIQGRIGWGDWVSSQFHPRWDQNTSVKISGLVLTSVRFSWDIWGMFYLKVDGHIFQNLVKFCFIWRIIKFRLKGQAIWMYEAILYIAVSYILHV